ncbi:MAG: IS66-like element accessory protein TnpA [Terriglobales bacterium]
MRWSVAEKQRLVDAARAPGASVARVARENAVNANQLYAWRRRYLAGRLGAPAEQALVPVRVAAEPRERRREARPAAGAIELELSQGRLRIEAGADAALLRLLLGHLLA